MKLIYEQFESIILTDVYNSICINEYNKYYHTFKFNTLEIIMMELIIDELIQFR
jgi:hypothetical protein